MHATPPVPATLTPTSSPPPPASASPASARHTLPVCHRTTCFHRRLHRHPLLPRWPCASPAADDTVSGECRQELASFKADRATNVNKDVPLALACRRDIRRHCRPKSLRNGPAAIMDCLRKKRKKVWGARLGRPGAGTCQWQAV